MKCNFIYVTYQHDAGLLRNVASTREVFVDSKIIVIDNDTTRKTPLRVDASYVINAVNDRFAAYNLAVPYLEHPVTCFRTDDDLFNEHATYLAAQLLVSDLLVTPYIYNGNLRDDRTPQRPIETVLFKTAALTSLLPFANQPSADWQLLVRAFNTCSVTYSDEQILNKIIHGRPQ